jgi:hypothetical protein
LPFPAWGQEIISLLFSTSPQFFPVILNFFPNKLYYEKQKARKIRKKKTPGDSAVSASGIYKG